MSPPDAKSRQQIFELQLKKFPCDNVDVAWLVEHSVGFSGAEVVAACGEAAMLAVEERSEVVSMKHLQAAISATVPQITPEVIAFYETFYKNHTMSPSSGSSIARIKEERKS